MFKNNIKLMLFSVLSISLFSGCFSSPEPIIPDEVALTSITNQKISNKFNEMEQQGVVKRKDLQYLRPDDLIVREPRKFLVWSRSDVIKIDDNFLYVVPEGYRYLQETAGEIYIDFEPTREEESLLIEN